MIALLLIVSSALAHDSTEYDICIPDAQWDAYSLRTD